MRRRDTGGLRVSGAIVAALVALGIDVALPLIPLYGNGHQFLFALGFPGRAVAAQFVAAWSSALAVLFGLVLLLRHRSGVAAGAFAAVALLLAGDVASTIVQTTGLFGHWQAELVIGLETLEAAALGVAASIAVKRWT